VLLIVYYVIFMIWRVTSLLISLGLLSSASLVVRPARLFLTART
jgi:hypothetical protein